MAIDVFSVRRPLHPPVGTAAAHAGGEVHEPRLRELCARIALADVLARDALTMPAAPDREGYYGDRHLEYWLSGLDDWAKVDAAARAAGCAPRRVLDFGGASGRVARHFALQGGARVALCDVNVNNVDWVTAHLPCVTAFKNSVLPHLPLRDGSLDLVTAFSVFTHVDVYEQAWLSELARVLRPGGVLYLTIHDEHTWRVLPDTFVFSVLRESAEFNARWPSAEMPDERLVFTYSDADVYNCNVFHSSAYVRRVWGRRFDVLEVVPARHGYQAAVVLRNPE